MSGFASWLRGLGTAPQDEVAVGSILPLAKSKAGETRMAVPEGLRSLARGGADLLDTFAAPPAFDPQRAQALPMEALGALMALGMGGGASFGPKVAGNELAYGVFAGPKSRTANLPLMNKAIDRIERMPESASLEDANSEAIRGTGWFLGADMSPRYEIPDHSSKLKLPWTRYPETMLPQSKQTVERLAGPKGWTGDLHPGEVGVPASAWNKDTPLYLKDVMEHPELFAAYPELQEIQIKPDAIGGTRGSYSGKDKTIRLGAAQPKQVQSTLLHEAQHAIQDIEGFSNGGNSSMFLTPELEAQRKAVKEQVKTAKEFARGAGQNAWGVNEILQKDKLSDFDTRYHEKELEWLRSLDDQQIYSLVRAARADKLDGEIGDKLYGAYKALAGETEARNVQHRFENKTTPNVKPWETQDVPYNQQSVYADPEEFAQTGAKLVNERGEPVPEISTEVMQMLQGLAAQDNSFVHWQRPEFLGPAFLPGDKPAPSMLDRLRGSIGR